MRNAITVKELDVINIQRFNTYFNLNRNSEYFLQDTESCEILTAEGCRDFSHYIKETDLGNNPEIIVLSSQHHYYNDAKEMGNVNTVISLKELNQIKELKGFLESILEFLSQNINFIGRFRDSRSFASVFKLSLI